jgi:hypothetical protein
MLTYKHLLPRGIAGKNEANEEKVGKKKSKKVKSGIIPTIEDEMSKGFRFAKSLGGVPIATPRHDSLTKQILTESTFLPRKAAGVAERDFPLRSQNSFPETHSTIRNSASGTLGMGGLNYSPLVRSNYSSPLVSYH